MLGKPYLTKLRKQLHSYAGKRVDVIHKSGEALHHAKRAIFALHRDNVKEAKEKLEKVEKIFKALGKKYQKTPQVFSEGSYKAALEEYVEARLFYNFLTNGKVGEIEGLKIGSGVFLAGLCDLPGELYRYAIKSATNKDIVMAKKCAKMAQDIIGELSEFNLTSYLRTKFDQAKGAVNRLEYVVYELSMREKK